MDYSYVSLTVHIHRERARVRGDPRRHLTGHPRSPVCSQGTAPVVLARPPADRPTIQAERAWPVAPLGDLAGGQAPVSAADRAASAWSAGLGAPARPVAASRAAPSTAAAKPSPRNTPAAPLGMLSAKTVKPASIGRALVSMVDTPAVARTVPRWKASCRDVKARPWQAGSAAAKSHTGLVPPPAALVPTSPAQHRSP